MDENSTNDAGHGVPEDRTVSDGSLVDVPDPNGRYTCRGPRSRQLFEKLTTSIEEHYVLHRSNEPELDIDSWMVSLRGVLDTTELSVDTHRREYPKTTIVHMMSVPGTVGPTSIPRSRA